MSFRNQGFVNRAAVLACAALIAVEVSAIFLHPASLSEDGLRIFLLSVLIAAGFAIFAIVSRNRGTAASHTAARAGALAGLLLGLFECGNITFEYSPLGSQSVRALAGGGGLAMLALAHAIAGSIGYERTARLRLAIWSALWCALISATLLSIFGFSYDLAFMSHRIEITRPDYLRSGMRDPAAFVIRNTMANALTHLSAMPVLAVIFGSLAGVVSAFLRRQRRYVAALLGVGCILQLGVSVAVLRHALSLPRADRPPYIFPAMIVGGISLTYIYPVVATLLRRPGFGSGQRSPSLAEGAS